MLLFLIAYYAERKERKGSNLVSNPYVYSLSLAVYCTSWTFYGSVGKAANAGLSFLTIYIGPTLMAALWWVVLGKIVYICKENRITTMSDFIASRYGNSLFLSALVTLVAVIGITPYLGLQLKAVMTTFAILSGEPEGGQFAGWFITLVLGVFAIFFGARKVDVSERHGGLIFAIAFESAIKLVAFISVGLFVTYGLFDGVGGIFEKIRNSQFSNLMLLGQDSNVSFTEWTSLTFLSMMAIMFLPRQFHVSVVENSSYEHIHMSTLKKPWTWVEYLLWHNKGPQRNNKREEQKGRRHNIYNKAAENGMRLQFYLSVKIFKVVQDRESGFSISMIDRMLKFLLHAIDIGLLTLCSLPYALCLFLKVSHRNPSTASPVLLGSSNLIMG